MQLCIVDAMFFVDTVDTGVCNFDTTFIYRVMRCENSTLYTMASNTIYVDTNAFNAIYVKAVDTFSSQYTHM